MRVTLFRLQWFRYGPYGFISVMGILGCLDGPNGPGKPVPGVPLPLAGASIVISEAMTSNANTLTDAFGDSPDWVELYNRSADSVNLKGFRLTDEKRDSTKWVFEDSWLAPNAYLLIFASGKNIKQPALQPAPRNMISTYISSYDDGDTAKRSFVDTLDFPEIAVETGEGVLLSAKIFRAAKSYGYVGFNMKFGKEGQPYDLSAYNRLVIRGMLEKNRKVNLQLCQDNQACYHTYSQVLTGKGDPDFEYVIPLDGYRPSLDMTRLTGVTFDFSGEWYGFTRLKIKEVSFAHSGYRLHTNFKLAASREGVYLYDSSGIMVDSLGPVISATDKSYGRILGNYGEVRILPYPTPGKPNALQGFTGTAKAPRMPLLGGFYDSAVTIILETDSLPGEIYFTIDGSVPDSQSFLYNGPIRLDSTQVFRYRRFVQGQLPSVVETATFFINDSINLPVLSIAAEPGDFWDTVTGIYQKGADASPEKPHFGANFWDDREVPVHLEFYEKPGILRFKEEAGVSIFGNWSRAHRKKSLAVFFRRKYGKAKLAYPLFPQYPEVKEFDAFLLRNSGGDYAQSMIRDALMGSLMAERGMDYQKYRPVVVYINGKYMGLHNLREKLNAGYFWSNYGLREDEIDLIKPWEEVMEGDLRHYRAMLDYLKNNDIRETVHFNYIRTQMDVHNFMDYMNAEIFSGNHDWPANNIKYWRPRTSGGKWKWVLYDLDLSLGIYNNKPWFNSLEHATAVDGPPHPNGPESTYLLRRLLENESFKSDFINRMCTLLGSTLSKARVTHFTDSLAAGIQGEIRRDIMRWRTGGEWLYSVKDIRKFVNIRADSLYGHYQAKFDCGDLVKLTLNFSNKKAAINGMEILNYPFTGTYFSGVPISVSDMEGKYNTLTLQLAADTAITPWQGQ